jgi:hypothetical protein
LSKDIEKIFLSIVGKSSPNVIFYAESKYDNRFLFNIHFFSQQYFLSKKMLKKFEGEG